MARKIIFLVLIGAILMLIGWFTPYLYDSFYDGFYDQTLIFWLWFQYRVWSDGEMLFWFDSILLSISIIIMIVVITLLISGFKMRSRKFSYNESGVHTTPKVSKNLTFFWIISGILTIVLSFIALGQMFLLYPPIPRPPPPPNAGFYLVLVGGIVEVITGIYSLYILKSNS